MPYARTNLEDTLGEDYADLDSILEHDGRFTPGSNHSLRRQGYRISFRSVDDEELQRVMRSLTTPVPSTMQANHHDDDLQQYKQRPDDAQSLKSGSSRGYHDRSESVMLFRKLNRGDDEVSLDLVSSELKDFIDPSLLEDTMSRPASRTPSTPKKPYDVSFEQQQQQHLKQQQQQQQQQNLKQQQQQQQQQHLKQPLVRNDRKHSLDARLVNNNSRQSMIDRRRSVAVVESEDAKDGRMNAMLSKSARKTEELLQAIRRTSFIRDSSEPIDHTPKHYTTFRNNPTTSTYLNKRQSMDIQVLLALKKDTDAILERRASLLSKARPNNNRPINDNARDDDPHQMRRGSTYGGEQSTSFEHRYHNHPPRTRTRSKLSSDDDTVVRDQMASTLSSNTTTTTSSDTSSSSSLRRVRTVSMPEKHRVSSTKPSELPFEEPVVNLRSRASRNMMIRNRESRPSPSSSSTLSRASDSLPETLSESVVEETKPHSNTLSSSSSNHNATYFSTRSSSSSYRSSRRVTVCDPAIPNQNQQQSLPRTRNRSSTVLDDRNTSLRSRRNTVSSARPIEHHQILETAQEEPSVAEMANDILTSIRQRHTTTAPRTSTTRIATSSTRERSPTLSGSTPSRYSSIRSRRMTVSGNDNAHDDEDYGLKLSSNSAARRYSSRPSQHQSTVLYRLPNTRHRESYA